MAVVSRVATIRIDDPATHNNFRQWVATAAVEQTPEGGSVVVTIEQTTGGVPPPAQDEYTLSIKDSNGATLFSKPLVLLSTTQDVTVLFRVDPGSAASAARHGTLLVDLTVALSGLNGYYVTTGGATNNPPAGFHTHTRDRGYIIGTTTKTHSFSNVAAGGAKAQPAEYDESLFFRVTLGSPSFVARPLGVVLSAGSLSGDTNSSVAANRDITFANVVDDRFAATVTSVTATVTPANDAITGVPYTVFTATTADSINVDPRVDAESHLWQVDDDVFGTPPMSKNDASKQALVSSYSAIAYRIVTARTRSGINGLSWTFTGDPRNPGSNKTLSGVTATRGTQPGWTDLFQIGPFVIGGAWDITFVITGPADIDSAPHLLNGTDMVTILAPDPRLNVFVSATPKTTSEDDHLHAGDAIRLVATAYNRDTRKRVAPDAGSVQYVTIRWSAVAQRFEYLAANGTTWVHWVGETTVADGPLMTDAGDGVTFTHDFNATNGWGDADVVGFAIIFKVGGTPYGFYVPRELVGRYASHAVAHGLGTHADVDLVTSRDNGDAIIWNDAMQLWVPFNVQGQQGLTGPKGDKGDLGAKGDTGAKGNQGDQGIQGLQGIQGVKGDKGDQGIQGVPGVKGDKGDKGDPGIQGPPGSAGLAFDGEVS